MKVNKITIKHTTKNRKHKATVIEKPTSAQTNGVCNYGSKLKPTTLH
jgi:hypothetical protein